MDSRPTPGTSQPFTQQQLPDPFPFPSFPSFLYPRAPFHNGTASPCHQSQQHASSAPCQGCYSHCTPGAPGKKRINSRVLCTARLTLLKLQRLVLEDSPSFRIVEKQVGFLNSGLVFLTHSQINGIIHPPCIANRPVQPQQGGSRGWMLPLSQAKHQTTPSYSPSLLGHTWGSTTLDTSSCLWDLASGHETMNRSHTQQWPRERGGRKTH